MRESPPIHPGEILLEEFLKPMDISQYQLAQDIPLVPPGRILKRARRTINLASLAIWAQPPAAVY